MEEMERDYEARPELDYYEGAGLDDADQEELSANARREVDAAMDNDQRRRDNMQRRVPGALLDGEFDNEEEEMML